MLIVIGQPKDLAEEESKNETCNEREIALMVMGIVLFSVLEEEIAKLRSQMRNKKKMVVLDWQLAAATRLH